MEKKKKTHKKNKNIKICSHTANIIAIITKKSFLGKPQEI